MRVVIDASFLVLPPSGTATYVRSLVQALSEVAPELDVRLIQPAWERDRSSLAPSRASVLLWPWQQRLRRASWDIYGVWRRAARERPDLVHVPHFAAPVRAGCPLVVTIHDVIPLVLPKYRASPWMRAHLAVMRRTVRAARLILTPSRAAKDDIVRMLGVPSQRIRVTPEAAGPEFRPAEDWTTVHETVAKFRIRGRYIFNVGGFDIRKNLPVLLEAFGRALPRLQEPAQLVIAGAPHTANPRVFPPMQPLIERLGLSGTVILTGRVTEAEKLALYQGAALYVTPSLYEGFGLTALEAMACGVPTIAANRTSLPEVVGEGGILVEPEPEPLATAIAAVLNDPVAAATWRARALTRAATFDWRRTAQLTLDAYREALLPEIAKGMR